MWATCPRSASSGYHAEFHEGYQKHTNPLNCRTSSSDISGHHADFHEGHGTVREWRGRGMACAISLHFSGVLRNVQRQFPTDVSAQSIGPIFKGQEIQTYQTLKTGPICFPGNLVRKCHYRVCNTPKGRRSK
jgi:hypothetical protein